MRFFIAISFNDNLHVCKPTFNNGVYLLSCRMLTLFIFFTSFHTPWKLPTFLLLCLSQSRPVGIDRYSPLADGPLGAGFYQP